MIDGFIMAASTAATYRKATAGKGDALDPRLIEAGAYAGKCFLPARCAGDAAFVEFIDNFERLTKVTIDPSEAWPEKPE